jgi:hypothetical protein
MGRPAILGLVELLLRKDGEEQAESFDLLRIEDAVEEIVIVIERNEVTLRGSVANLAAGILVG